MNTPGTAAAVCTTNSDAALACSIVAGEPGAFERLMREHNRRLFRVARSILRDDAEAEDALQEGYIKAHRAMAGFRGDARLSTWLTRIIVNQALECRRRRPLEAAEQGGDEPSTDSTFGSTPETPETLAIRHDLQRLIERAIDDLPVASAFESPVLGLLAEVALIESAPAAGDRDVLELRLHVRTGVELEGENAFGSALGGVFIARRWRARTTR